MRSAALVFAVILLSACSAGSAAPAPSSTLTTMQSSPDVASGDTAGYETDAEVRATCRSTKDDRILSFIARITEHMTLAYPKSGACTIRDPHAAPLFALVSRRNPIFANPLAAALGRATPSVLGRL